MSRQAPQAIPQEKIPIETSAAQNNCLLHASLMPIFAYYYLPPDQCPEEYKPTQKYVMDMLTRTDLICHMPKKEKVLQDPQGAIIKFTQDFFRVYCGHIIGDNLSEDENAQQLLRGCLTANLESLCKGLPQEEDPFAGMLIIQAKINRSKKLFDEEKAKFTMQQGEQLSVDEWNAVKTKIPQNLASAWWVQPTIMGPDLIEKLSTHRSDAQIPHFKPEEIQSLKLFLHLEGKLASYEKELGKWWDEKGLQYYKRMLSTPGIQLSGELLVRVAKQWKVNLTCLHDGKESYALHSVDEANAPTIVLKRTEITDGAGNRTGHYSGCLPAEVIDVFNQQVIAAKGKPLIISKSPEHHRDESETQQQQQQPKHRFRRLSEGGIPQNPTPLAAPKQDPQSAKRNTSSSSLGASSAGVASNSRSAGTPDRKSSHASSFSSNGQSVFQSGDFKIVGALPNPNKDESGARPNKQYEDKPCKVTKGDVTMWVTHPSANQLEIRARHCENKQATPEQIFGAMATQFLGELLNRYGKDDVSNLSSEEKEIRIELIQPDNENSRNWFGKACTELGLTPVFVSNSNTYEKGKSITDALQGLRQPPPGLASGG